MILYSYVECYKEQGCFRVWGDILSLRLTAITWCPSGEVCQGSNTSVEFFVCYTSSVILWDVFGCQDAIHQPYHLPFNSHHIVYWSRYQENKNITHLHSFNYVKARPSFFQKGKETRNKDCNFPFISRDLIVLFTEFPRFYLLTNSVQS